MFLKTFRTIINLPKIITNLNTIKYPVYRNTTRFYFTSSSDSTQVALLEEVEAKIFQVLKTAAKCNTSKLTKAATFE